MIGLQLPTKAPPWVKAGARYDMDFANGRYWGTSIWLGSSLDGGIDHGSCIRGATNGVLNQYTEDGDGILRLNGQYAPRITKGRGIWAEEVKTNFALWSRDLTNAAWTKLNATVSKNQIGADLVANSASLLTASSSLGTCLQAVGSLTLGNYIDSAYIKRAVGTGVIEMTCDGTTWTDITSQLSTTKFTLISVPQITAVTAANIGFRITTSGDAIVVDFVQLEAGPIITSRLMTTSATNARGTDEPHFGITGGSQFNDGSLILRNIWASGRPMGVYIEFSGDPNVAGGATGWLLSSDLSGANIGGGADGSVVGFRNAFTPNNGIPGKGNLNKFFGRSNGFGSQCCLNGYGLSAIDTTYKGTLTSNVITHSGIGMNGGGTTPGALNGYIGRIAFWDRDTPDHQVIETTVL